MPGDAVRHPGSTIKPIASYSLAVENDIIHFSSLVEDSPITITENGVQRTWPVNFYGSYLGNITVNIAIQRSTNTIPVKLQQIITPQVSFNFLKNKLASPPWWRAVRKTAGFFRTSTWLPWHWVK